MDAGSTGARYGPRERALQLGEARLSDAECLALVLRTGTRGEPVEQLSQRLLRDFGGLSGLAARGVRELRAPGLGPARAASLVAAFGLARRLAEEDFRPGRQLRDARDVAAWIRHAARGARRERFYVVLLDVRSRVIGLRVVSTGLVDAAPVHPREVFGPAVREAASAVVLAHNHPSGSPEPSQADIHLTKQLTELLRQIDIRVLDHIVVGTGSCVSFASRGLL